MVLVHTAVTFNYQIRAALHLHEGGREWGAIIPSYVTTGWVAIFAQLQRLDT